MRDLYTVQISASDGECFEASLSRPIDISRPVCWRASGHHTDGDDGTAMVTAFGLPVATETALFHPSKAGGCYCSTITFVPHANGSHVESVRHVVPAAPLTMCLLDKVSPLIPALLLRTEKWQRVMGAALLDAPLLEHAIKEAWPSSSSARSDAIEAIIVGTLASQDHAGLHHVDFTRTNPPHFTADGMRHLIATFPRIKYLLTDLPSVDAESDGGLLSAHRVFWELDPATAAIPDAAQKDGEKCHGRWSTRLIGELCRIPAGAASGLYLLSMNIAAMQTDALPFRPVIYPCVHKIGGSIASI